METERRSSPGLDLPPEWVAGMVGRWPLLPVLEGSSFLWQDVGFEGHRDRAKWAKIPSIGQSVCTSFGENSLMSWLAGFIWQECQQRAQALSLRIRRTDEAYTRVRVMEERELRTQDGARARDGLRRPGELFFRLDFEFFSNLFCSVNNSLCCCLSQGDAWTHSPYVVWPEHGGMGPATVIPGVSY